MILLFIYLNTALTNLAVKEISIVAQLRKQMSQVKLVCQEYEEMLGSLEEGILVAKNMTLNFANQIFLDILEKSGIDLENLMDAPLFRVYRSADNDDPSTKTYV